MPDQIKYQEGMVYEDSLNIDFLDQLISEEGYIKAINKHKEEQKKKAKQLKPAPTPDIKSFKPNPGTLTGIAQIGKAIRKKKRKK
jgi:hypothetical protein